MNHRHLHPEEIDLLLDDGEGFGVAPLRGHLEQCNVCQAEFRRMRKLVGALEALPHLNPGSRFAERVMSQVQVFEPWHVAVRDRLKSFTPRSGVARVAVGIGGGAIALAMTVGFIWIAHRADALIFLASLVMQRTRDALTGTLSGVVSSLMGESVASAVKNGGVAALVLTIVAALIALGAVALGVKAVATAGSRRRN